MYTVASEREISIQKAEGRRDEKETERDKEECERK